MTLHFKYGYNKKLIKDYCKQFHPNEIVKR